MNKTILDYGQVPALNDFLSIKSKEILEAKEIEFDNNRGEFYESKGMRTPYLGAFTSTEESFLKYVFKTFKRKFILTHTEDDQYVDIHLFSGSSKLGTFRIDINPKTNATHITTVQEVLKFLIKHNKKFDVILLDPPYNKRYDSKYQTRKYNCEYNNYAIFLQDLIHLCKKVIADYGLLISKNWRSITINNFKYLTGITTNYGGFRRNTILEIFQYFPKYSKEHQFTFSEKDFFSLNPKNKMGKVSFIRSKKGKWIEREISFIYSLIKDYPKFDNSLYIGDQETPRFGLDFQKISFYDYVNWKPKSERKGKFKLRNLNDQKYDIIIVDESSKLGGNTRATSVLKVLLRKEIKQNGYIVIKSYFDPVLEKSNTFNSKEYQSPLVLVDKIKLLYDFEKSSSIHIYRKDKDKRKDEEGK
jgi:hypothetical protein